jgi:hypothetical protein
MTDDGLPPPSLPQHHPSPPREEGLPPGFVNNSITDILGETGGWRRKQPPTIVLPPAGEPPSGAQIPTGGGALTPMHSMADDLFIGTAQDALEVAGNIATSPFQTLTSMYEAEKLNQMIDDFRRSHEPQLNQMNGDRRDAFIQIPYLQQVAADFWQKVGSSTDKASAILVKKREQARSARDMLDQVDRRLQDGSLSSEERGRLQAMQDDLARWVADANARITGEQQEIDALDVRLSLLNRQIFTQAQGSALLQLANNLERAADHDTELPTTFFVAGARQYLLGLRASLDQAIAGVPAR